MTITNPTAEEWRDIPGYNGMYQVSNCGRIKSVERYIELGHGWRIQPEKLLSLHLIGKGYIGCNLYWDGTMTNFYVHRLVANSFVDNPLNLPEVNHKDLVKTNNYYTNLEWCTQLQNQIHSSIHYGLSSEAIAEVRLLGNTYMPRKQIADKFHISVSQVGRIITNKRRKNG